MVFNDRQFMHHDARGIVGPYTAVPLMVGNQTWFKLTREGCDRPAYASARSLALGLRPGLHGKVGWVPVP